ncbi:MAG TPA: DUF4349 domain-containing protein [Nocardioides sp.]|nr:DUF4349 domain-containing protein [Nocardioides sp.]
MRGRLIAGSLLAAVAVSVTACASPSSNGASGAGDAAEPQAAPASAGSVARDEAAQTFGDAGKASQADVQQRAVISTGQIELVSRDVTVARDRIDAILAEQGGRIGDENTETDKKGTVTHMHLVLRVPSNRFPTTMNDLAGVATLRSSTRKAEDVTTRVIDTDARIAAQRDGVHRLRQLVTRAANLPALLAVERELTARQADLESLLQQRAYLADRTSLATITVDIDRRVPPPPAKPAKHEAGGFVGGLQHGWHALVVVVVGLLVALGAALPLTVALALVGIPAWLVVRRFRRPREPEAPPAES